MSSAAFSYTFRMGMRTRLAEREVAKRLAGQSKQVLGRSAQSGVSQQSQGTEQVFRDRIWSSCPAGIPVPDSYCKVVSFSTAVLLMSSFWSNRARKAFCSAGHQRGEGKQLLQ
mmetsp:Transcript_109866/g.200059  ORF Transcript_109866/g.200059 Transcript_109866/m.200059 type:complete len:113 (-) Transcript_109866:59-397(-)